MICPANVILSEAKNLGFAAVIGLIRTTISPNIKDVSKAIGMSN